MEEKVRPEVPINIDKKLSSLIRNCWDSEHSKRPSDSDIIEYLNLHEDIFNKFNQLGWLPNKTDLPNSTKKRVQYGRYEVRGKYSFVYQPERLMDLSYAALYKKILSDMRVASDFIEQHDIQMILSSDESA